MSRKVSLTIKTRTMIPVISTMNLLAVLDDDTPLHRAISQYIAGKHVRGATIEDSSIETVEVENADGTLTPDFRDQVIEAFGSPLF